MPINDTWPNAYAANAAQTAWPNGSLQISTNAMGVYPMQMVEPNTSRVLGLFTVTKVENGLILGFNNKTYIVKNGQELAEQIVAIIAAEELK